MVRTYKRKTNQGGYGNDQLKLALEKVQTGIPLLVAAKEFKIPPRTLRRHRDGRVANPGVSQLGRYRNILSTQVENELHAHIKHMEKSLYGLTTNDVRRLAYDVSEKCNLKHPFSHEKKMAGRGWLRAFLLRHKDISIRVPQGTNISRAVGFNKPKVQQFFGVYRQLLESKEFTPRQVWNMDETGVTNVHKPGKVLATRGIRQVGKMSGERGKNVTVICAMNAIGVYVPPMFIFPRKRMNDTLMTGAPPQSVGYANPSGWTDSELFIKLLEHFASFTNATQGSHEQIVILDGHHSHKTLAAVTFARAHGIHLLTLPPHSTHKMQPLDRTYFKSLKSAYNVAADSWMVSHPGRRISFFDMAGIFGQAFHRSATQEKCINGFRMRGIWPFDENVFSDEDFAAATVTDQPEPDNNEIVATEDPDVRPDLPNMPSTGDSSEEDEGPDDPESHRGLSHDGEPSASIPSSCGETPLTTVKSPGSSDIAGATQQTNSDDLIHQECTADITQLIRSLSPLPKLAAPRSRKRKSEEATLLTASPYKDQLVEKQNMKALKDKKGKSTGSRRKGKATTIKKPRGLASTSP
ncbi:uncharacterized protein LOC135463456 [Liolophura sinensis]|uniref:uncharacterized protein LOC135463456 n=1 Tax=Liolophura sinensis TaxID=3198878 RepID=UPI003159462A